VSSLFIPAIRVEEKHLGGYNPMGTEDWGLGIETSLRNLSEFEADLDEYERRPKVYGAVYPNTL